MFSKCPDALKDSVFLSGWENLVFSWFVDTWVWKIFGPKTSEIGSGDAGKRFLAKKNTGYHQDHQNWVRLNQFRGQLSFWPQLLCRAAPAQAPDVNYGPSAGADVTAEDALFAPLDGDVHCRRGAPGGLHPREAGGRM